MKYWNQSRGRNGFTLTELLVVIFIIAILATVGFVATSRVKLAAAKVGSIAKMREIGSAVALWTTESPSREPFFLSSGTGDYPQETGYGDLTRPGNPGIALFNVDDPESGYVTDPDVFFSPLVKSDIPSIADYNPSNLSGNSIWGTFVWCHPFVEVENRTGWQTRLNPADNPKTQIAPNLSGRLLMMENYSKRTPMYDEEYYHALMIDNSVVYVGEGSKVAAWKRGR